MNGAPATQGFSTEKDFALGFFSEDCEPLFAKIPSEISESPANGINVCDLGYGRYFLSFSPAEKGGETHIFSQTRCKAGNTTHLITMCKRKEFLLVTETPGEIYEIVCPCPLSGIKVKAVGVKNGYLLRITATAQKKKLIAYVYYEDDYLPVLEKFCDDFSFDGPDVLIKEDLGGCNRCTRTQRYAFRNGAFVKTERSFVYKRCHEYPDELLPYLLIEKLLFGDDAGAEELLGRNLSVPAVREILGEYDSVADFGFLPYRPFIAGVYKNSGYCRVRYFSFGVKDGLITGIFPLRG